MSEEIVVRLRGRDGMFRGNFNLKECTILDLKKYISENIGVDVQSVTIHPFEGVNRTASLEETKTLNDLSISNGMLLKYEYDHKKHTSKQAKKREEESEKKKITVIGKPKETNILTFLEEEEQMNIYIRKQMDGPVLTFSMDHNAGHYFEQYCRNALKFHPRMGYIYGKSRCADDPSENLQTPVPEEEKKYISKVNVKSFLHLETSFIYEPDQELSPISNFVREKKDLYKTRTNKIAALFNLKKIGWIYCSPNPNHEPSPKDLIRMALMQNMFGDHFVTVTVHKDRLNPGLSSFSAYQVSQQFCDLVKAELLKKEQLNSSLLETIVPVKIYGKATTLVESSWVLRKIPIRKCKSMFYMGFTPRNRPGALDGRRELARIVRKRRGMKFAQVIADFHLLLYLTDLLSLERDFPYIAKAMEKPAMWEILKKYEMIVSQHVRAYM